jgi:hypothetical protein
MLNMAHDTILSFDFRPNIRNSTEHPTVCRYAVGAAQEHGVGCTKNETAALSSYKAAAMLGHTSSQCVS